ncbi:MAG TPA: prolyl oligopeptidase family serine peptidase [Acidobacteriota bacterium]|nr:prolyl oligopeptidase family serine peptidase [Acidobacteriota bacterium]
MRESSILILPLAMWMFAGFGSSQTKFTIDQVLGAPFPTELTASPDGKRVAWFSDDQGRRNIWVAEAPQYRPRRLTSFTADDGQALTQLTWSPNSESVAFVRGGAKNNAGETPNPANDPAGTEQAVWAVKLSDGVPRKLGGGADPDISLSGEVAFVSEGAIWVAPLSASAPARQLFKARGRNDNPAWSPDGRTLAFVSDREDHSFIGLYRTGGNEVRYIAPSVDRDSAPRWSSDGKRIAFVRQPGRGGDPPAPGTDNVPEPWSILIADVETLHARQVWASGAAPDASLPRLAGENLIHWAADGSLVFFSEQDGWAHLYAISSSGGNPALLTPGECEVEHVSFSTDRRTIYYSSNCGDIDRRHLWRVPVSGGIPTAVTGGEDIEWNPAALADGGLAFFRSSARMPAAPYVLAAPGTKARPIAPDWIPAEFPADSLVVPRQIVFKSADGWDIHGQLFLPLTKHSGKIPAVIFMHGGPVRQMLLGWHYLYYYSNAYGMNEYLANRGYAVLSVNFRSGIGYGRKFREAPGRGPRGASEYQDIVAAGNYLRSRDDIDPSRIGLWGGSYGGYLTALGLARNSDMFAAGVDLHGVHDWSTRRFRSWAGTESADVVKRARDSSPVASVDKWKSPVLLIQGDDDRNVDFSQTVDLAQRLRAQRVEIELMVLPDEVHDFLMHRHWLAVYRAAADFFDRHLK